MLKRFGREFPVLAAKFQLRRLPLVLRTDVHIGPRNRIDLAKIMPSTLVIRPDIG